MKPTDEQFLKIFKQINLNDRVNVINITKRYLPDSDASYFTVREWIDSRVQFVNIEIDKMLKYYSPYINSELMMIMEEILKSSMHNVMFNIILKSPNNSSFAECDTDFILKPYYELMEKLKEISKEYQL